MKASYIVNALNNHAHLTLDLSSADVVRLRGILERAQAQSNSSLSDASLALSYLRNTVYAIQQEQERQP